MSGPQQFRKKPVVIEAMNWPGGAEAATPVIDWVLGFDGTARYHSACCHKHTDEIWVDTLEGTMQANPGDWIIRGIKDEFYPCKPDIFEATYEPVQP